MRGSTASSATSRAERAIELLDEVIALGAKDAEFRRTYPYLMAHVELYKAHLARGDVEQVRDYYSKAVRLGATPEQLARGRIERRSCT
jgi:tetratricopeptide (TPR) repeat protein